MIRSSEKYAKQCAKVWFLKQCREHKVIPKTLQISNKPNDESLMPEWTAATETTCLEWLRLALVKEETRERELLQDVTDKLDTLVVLREAII